MPLEAFGTNYKDTGIPLKIFEVIPKLVQSLNDEGDGWLNKITQTMRNEKRPDAQMIVEYSVNELSTEKMIWFIASFFGREQICYSEICIVVRLHRPELVQSCKITFSSIIQPLAY